MFLRSEIFLLRSEMPLPIRSEIFLLKSEMPLAIRPMAFTTFQVPFTHLSPSFHPPFMWLKQGSSD